MYDFKQLSPADFEELTRDLLQKHWDVTLESFKTGRDSGIDLRFSQNSEKEIIVQCKHFANSTTAKLLYELQKIEVPKIIGLAPKRYVLVTSLPLNPADKEKLRKVLNPFVLSTNDIYGANDLNNLLGLHPEIEVQHFKLWLSSASVLQRVLHNAEHVQTNFDVDGVKRAFPLYVQNKNYNRAMDMLDKSRFVIISGVPGIGKTTLADMLLFSHLEAAYQPVVIKSDIAEGRKFFNNELRQIFYFDDFLGETFLGGRFDFIGRKEDSAILDFIDIVSRSKHTKLILTTREHILQHAFQISERFQREKIRFLDHRCVLELTGYTLLDRARILYNHIYFSDLPIEYRAELLQDNYYMGILKHRNFNPRLVEWLARLTNVKSLPVGNYRKEVSRVLENPEQLWRVAFEHQISEASRSVLLALYSLGGAVVRDKLEKAWKALHPYRAGKYNWKTSPEDWRNSLQDLEGGFLSFNHQIVSFVNPSVKDFLDSTFVSEVDHLSDVLSSACFFDQIIKVWGLVKSEKGRNLRRRLSQYPEYFTEAIAKTLNAPHSQQVESVFGGYKVTQLVDAKPEARLFTLLSIAYLARSLPLFDMAVVYANEIVSTWSSFPPDFIVLTNILRLLDDDNWQALKANKLYVDIKEAMLNALATGAGSGDLAPVADYASDGPSRWTAEDNAALLVGFETYLEDQFDSELADCDSESACETLGSLLDNIASQCSYDIDAYHEELGERASELVPPEVEDDREARHWGSTEYQSVEDRQDAEVKRLFDGLS